MILSDSSTTYNGGMALFITRLICKYRHTNCFRGTDLFALTFRPHISLDHIVYVLNNTVVY